MIVIEPTDPEVVYVPSDNPTTVYCNWGCPSCPPPRYYEPGAGMMWGVGIAVTDSLGWGHDDIDVNRYNNFDFDHVMSFMIRHEGVVFEKDMGPQQRGRGEGDKAFNPDSGWEEVSASMIGVVPDDA